MFAVVLFRLPHLHCLHYLHCLHWRLHSAGFLHWLISVGILRRLNFAGFLHRLHSVVFQSDLTAFVCKKICFISLYHKKEGNFHVIAYFNPTVLMLIPHNTERMLMIMWKTRTLDKTQFRSLKDVGKYRGERVQENDKDVVTFLLTLHHNGHLRKCNFCK